MPTINSVIDLTGCFNR